MLLRHFFTLLLFTVSMVMNWGCSTAEENSPKKILATLPYQPLTDSIRKFPHRADLYLSRGLLLSQNNLHELATADYRKAWELQPDEWSGLEYSSNLMTVNDTIAALELLKECRSKFQDNPEFNRKLSELLAELGQFRAAITEYDILLKRDSLNFSAWYEKGILQLRDRDTAAALQSLQTSYQLHPSSFNGMALARVYSDLRDPRVIPLCDDLLQHPSGEPLVDLLYLKGIYYADQKNYRKALPLFEACLVQDWKFTDAHLEIGLIYFEQKMYPKALKTFERAATTNLTSADAYYWIGRCYQQLHQDTTAAQYYQKALAFDPTFTEAREKLQQLQVQKETP